MPKDKEFQQIVSLIKAFQKNLKAHLPELKGHVKQLIKEKTTDKNAIENTLDTLLSLTMHGVGDDLYIQLIEYYKTVDAEGAQFYWNEYDNQNE